LQLQADTQTTVTVLCLAGLHVLDKKKIKEQKTSAKRKTLKNVTKIKKKRFCIYA